MIARLVVQLPFQIAVPENTAFDIYTSEDQGIEVRYYPPVRTADATKNNPSSVTVNGTPGFFADGLRIDFAKPTFLRGNGITDPPSDVIERALTTFLTKYRYVISSPVVRTINWPQCAWKLQYLNDDESELPAADNPPRTLHALSFRFQFAVLDPSIWSDVFSLPVDFTPAPWSELLIDAHGAADHIGTMVVLAATSLEVFIGAVLNDLATHAQFSQPLWTWLNDRGALKDPTVEEQFDVLLRHFTGWSLKQDAALWKDFTSLKTARNTFVHQGRAMVGKAPLTKGDAARLTQSATKITRAVREHLPAELQWPVFQQHTKISFTTPIIDRGPATGRSSAVPTLPPASEERRG